MASQLKESLDNLKKEKPELKELVDEYGDSKGKIEYYSLERVLRQNCRYMMIIGERSNGKTYACLDRTIERYFKEGSESGYIRRYREDFRGKRGDSLYSNHIANGRIGYHSGHEYDGIKYYAGRWYVGKRDEDLNKLVTNEKPLCYGFSLSDMEHDKSTGYPHIKTVIFDEFLTRGYYLPNEFILFMNCLSTIIRHRSDVEIFMLGNTVNKYCPYFKEMGMTHIAEMEQGKIDVYTYGNSGLRVAVERCNRPKKGTKKSDVYFAFDNPELQMITDGEWEISLYPHLPAKYLQSDILFIYFIKFNDKLLQCEIIQKEDTIFTYIHEKTTPIQDMDNDIIFSEEFSARPNRYRNILRPIDKLSKKIAEFYKSERIFYQDNEIGEIIRNYIKWCKTVNYV